MSGSEHTSRRVASVEDADESDNPIEGTGRYAESVASPVKERPNTGRTRKEKTRRDSSSPLASGLTDSDSTVHPREKSARDRAHRDSREFSSPHKKALAISKQTLAMRPAPKHANTTPHPSYRSSDEAAYYGVTTVTPASSRPRARTTQRPASYYGNPPRPPPSNAQFYASRQSPAPAGVPTSYPPQSWAQAGPMVYPMMSPAAPPPPRDYFNAAPQTQHLLARFGGRPASAMGHRPSPALAYEDYELEEERNIVRRSSKKAKDRMQMPPPPRPQSARPGSMFRPPTTPAPRKGLRFEDDELDPDRGLFHLSPLATYEYPTSVPPPRARRPSFGAPSISYDSGSYRTEVAGSNRRNSYLGNNRHSVSSISDYEDKIRQAQAYQEDVAGGPQMPLTAETLRRASKNGSSSRSTRSSESRDESDYRQSATTRTTRSSNNNEEDFTIRIKGVRSVEVGGAKMHCDDGAEINIASRAPPPPQGYRGSSDKSSYIDPEDHRRIEDRRLPRIDRPPTRTRSGSQAGSFSRTPRYETAAPMPRYDSARYDQYGYPLPPYTTYPPPPPGYI